MVENALHAPDRHRFVLLLVRLADEVRERRAEGHEHVAHLQFVGIALMRLLELAGDLAGEFGDDLGVERD